MATDVASTAAATAPDPRPRTASLRRVDGPAAAAARRHALAAGLQPVAPALGQQIHHAAAVRVVVAAAGAVHVGGTGRALEKIFLFCLSVTVMSVMSSGVVWCQVVLIKVIYHYHSNYIINSL